MLVCVPVCVCGGMCVLMCVCACECEGQRFLMFSLIDPRRIFWWQGWLLGLPSSHWLY